MSMIDDLGCAFVAPWDRTCVLERVGQAVVAGSMAVAEDTRRVPATSGGFLGGLIDRTGAAVSGAEEAATRPLHEIANTTLYAVVGVGLFLLLAITFVIWWVLK